MRAKKLYRIGVDVGSTTLKVVVLSRVGEIEHKTYKRHKVYRFYEFKSEAVAQGECKHG
jgi:activator of 2-hydroxyglutaryl-CoA dehydratase